ncbi:antichymotrypsin-2 [Drosophila yakuba]|uniref:Nec n=1 Tax=Drosophila yakuba TaxID=7245 RepID=B4P1E8_DROYA|nr:antichymotrypsin-2 [Drosophila yakuba]EDW89150.1 nec [Drosophila yakuba]
MASKATILLLLTTYGHLLAAQEYHGWSRPPQQQQPRSSRPELGLRAQNTNPRTQDNQHPISDVVAVDLSKPEPTNAPPTRPPPAYSYMDRFSAELFKQIMKSQSQQNVVFSPFSVQALLALIYGASSGKTFRELQKAGEFSKNAMAVAHDFENVIKYKMHLEGTDLTLATKVYYNQELGGVNHSYDAYAKFYFSSDTEAVDMQNGKDTAARINAWVMDKTRSKIRELVTPGDMDPQTQALLVNAVYFQGRWEHEFAIMDTSPYDFHHSNGRTSKVAMMYNDDVYGLAELPELGATALELAYKDSATSMLILLPNQTNGLAKMMQQLSRPEFDLNRVAHRLRRQSVAVRLPKFQFEFEQDMTQPLKDLGIHQMFTPNSQVNKLLDHPVRVSKILQKAYINVGEAGTEASAASYAKFVPLSLPPKPTQFVANRPFVFAIRTPTAVLFIGHVENPTPMSVKNPEPYSDIYRN